MIEVERLHDSSPMNVIIRKNYYGAPTKPPLKKVELGCWFTAEVDPTRGGFAKNVTLRNSTPSVRELRAIADACNEIADAQEALDA